MVVVILLVPRTGNMDTAGIAGEFPDMVAPSARVSARKRPLERVKASDPSVTDNVIVFLTKLVFFFESLIVLKDKKAPGRQSIPINGLNWSILNN